MQNFLKDRFSRVLSEQTRDKALSALARETGLNRQQIHRYRSGRALPRADAFMSICSALNLNPFDFYSSAKTAQNDRAFTSTDISRIKGPSQTDLEDGGYLLFRPSLQRKGVFGAKACFISTISQTRYFYIRYKRAAFRLRTPKHHREFIGRIYNSCDSGTCNFIGVNQDANGRLRDIRTLFLGAPHPLAKFRLGLYCGPEHYPQGLHPYSAKAALVKYDGLTNSQIYRRSGFRPDIKLPVGVQAYFDEPLSDPHTMWATVPEL